MISFRAGSLSIMLPNPQLGNVDIYNLNYIARRAMDGTLYSYIKGNRVDSTKLSFVALSRDKVIEMIEFLKVTSGNAVIYRNWNSIDRIGKILNSPFDSSDHGNCMSEFTIDLEYV